jgi:hypothetical protein
MMKVRRIEGGAVEFSCVVQVKPAAESNAVTGQQPVAETVLIFGASRRAGSSEMESLVEPHAGAGTADLSLTARATPEPVGHLGSLTYHMEVVNHGPDTIQDAVIHDSLLPVGIPLLGIPISPITRVEINIVHPVLELPGSTITGTVSISSSATDPNPDDNSATLVSHVVALVVPAVTLAVVEGKHLTLQGTGFADGSVIEIDGKPVATRLADPTSLVAKKGGKQIAPGETVALTVVNPDGSLSAPFLYTRPTQ